MVEIARAVHHKADVIIFDEPTATLTPEEKRHFFALMKRLRLPVFPSSSSPTRLKKRSAMPTASASCVTANCVDSGASADFDRDKVVRAMVGRSLTGEIYNRRRTAADLRKRGKQILSVRDVSMGSMVRNNPFPSSRSRSPAYSDLWARAGQRPSRSSPASTSADFLRGGEIVFDGKPVRYNVPVHAVEDGIIYVTEDRKLEGFFETMSIAENSIPVRSPPG